MIPSLLKRSSIASPTPHVRGVSIVAPATIALFEFEPLTQNLRACCHEVADNVCETARLVAFKRNLTINERRMI